MGLCNCSDIVALLVFHFAIELWNCSDSVALLVFLLDFGSVFQKNNATQSEQFQSPTEK
jgi:hypothetical protein